MMEAMKGRAINHESMNGGQCESETLPFDKSNSKGVYF